MALREKVEAGNLTLVEASELSRLLREKMSEVHAPSKDDDATLLDDLILPLLTSLGDALLDRPERHLSAVRASLSRALPA